ncbi:DUF4249 domain-containing protein [Sphingobacterium multivorum]|uniref:DUF4249 domain-containing protein n=1 Tax=Sphingobacterium multivorum TaxID=28454 RepID=UPI0028A0CF5B|nr:DUF4249 domain-containing protein [Sphingobacterium multivorum]
MKRNLLTILALLTVLFSACEKVIDLELENSEARIVIEANLNDLNVDQLIRVTKTVAFGTDRKSDPISGASVVVRSSANEEITFVYERDGYYRAQNFRVRPGTRYSLEIELEGEYYRSSVTMPTYVAVDSLGISKEKIFTEERYYPTFKFYDPAQVNNYYLYEIAINNSPIRFASTYNDKFNDGKYVTHEISDRTIDLELNDEVRIIRYCIDASVYKFWNEFQSANPGGAAPGNPSSNISNGALGYFSVASAVAYFFKTQEYMDKLEQ